MGELDVDSPPADWRVMGSVVSSFRGSGAKPNKIKPKTNFCYSC